MKIIAFIFSVSLLMACNSRKETWEDHRNYISEYDSNSMKIGDTAAISVSYPQGTNFYQYELVDSLQLVQQVDHEVREGRADEAGGAMGESFIIKAVRPGTTIVKLVDRSGGAQQQLLKDSSWKNYRSYTIEITQ